MAHDAQTFAESVKQRKSPAQTDTDVRQSFTDAATAYDREFDKSSDQYAARTQG